MAAKTTYTCDLCRDELTPNGPLAGFALHYETLPRGWSLRVLVDKESNHHICAVCLSSIQQLPVTCGEGFSGCHGGTDCQFDHK